MVILDLHEPVQGGEALDLEALSELVVLGGVNLGEVKRGVAGGELGSSLHVLGGKLLAVTARK